MGHGQRMERGKSDQEEETILTYVLGLDVGVYQVALIVKVL